MDIVDKVATAITEIPGKPSAHEIARVAIEEYQKALWTPMFDQQERFGGLVPERRRRWAHAVTSHIMHMIGKYLCDHGDAHGARDASSELFEALYESGAYIVTDSDRTAAGLLPRGPYGFTQEELAIMEAKRVQAMLGPMPPMIHHPTRR